MINCLCRSPPKWEEFLSTANRAKPGDFLVLQGGRVVSQPSSAPSFNRAVRSAFYRAISKAASSKALSRLDWSKFLQSSKPLGVELARDLAHRVFKGRASFRDFTSAAQQVHQGVIAYNKGRVHHLSATTEEENRKARHAFVKVVERTFSPEWIDDACKRYKINWKAFPLSSKPLDRMSINVFALRALNCYTDQLKTSNGKHLSDSSPEEIAVMVSSATRHGSLSGEMDPRSIHGAPMLPHENFIPDAFSKDRQRTNLFCGINKLESSSKDIFWQDPYLQRLSMAIVSLIEPNDEGLVIPAPTADRKVDYYQVYRVISRGGLTAVALLPISKSSTLKPILAFRCTKQAPSQSGAIDSVLNDIEQNIGESGYEAAKQSLHQLMEDREFNRGKKIEVIAYSLGGGHATRFMVDHWRKVETFTGFNFVGTSASVVDDLANQINRSDSDEIPPTFSLHRINGDWVNGCGEKAIGCGITNPNALIQFINWDVGGDLHTPTHNIWDWKEWQKWLDVHGARPMEPGKAYGYQIYRGPSACTEQLDTAKINGVLEKLRLQLGFGILHRLISFFYSYLNFFLRLYQSLYRE